MKTVKLDNPVTENGVEVSEITLRPVTVGDILITEKRGNSDLEKEIILIANLASVLRETIEKLCLKDYTKIQEALKDFFHRLHKGFETKCVNALFRCRWRH